MGNALAQVYVDKVTFANLPVVMVACGDGFLSFFLSWVSKTQPNHWTKRMAST